MGLYRTSEFLSIPQAFLNFLTHIHFRNGEKWPRVIKTTCQLNQLGIEFNTTFLCKGQAQTWFCKNLTKHKLKAVGLVCRLCSGLFTSPATWCKDQRFLIHLSHVWKQA